LPATEFRIAASSTAPAAARSELAPLLDGLPRATVDDVMLLTSELVTNAVRHTSSATLGDVLLRVDTDASHVRVEVLNPGAAFDPPTPQTPSTTGTGLGLFLVDALASSWAVETEDARTKVWFELPIAEDVSEPRERSA
jgi:anti-sigma regulatory factor (Ser/Thr protein kinase)